MERVISQKGNARKNIISKLVRSGLALLLAIVLFVGSGAKIPVFEANTDLYFQDAIKKAGLAYATCRIVNASVSILKESSLKLEPAGIGVSLALGQALDPIDDMTERLSDVLVTAITSLGVQDLNTLKEISLPEIDGLMGTIENSALFLKEKTRALNLAITTLTNNMSLIIETLLTLTFLYVGVFFIQVILLPVLTFWLLIKVTNAFFSPASLMNHNALKGDNHAICEH
ncbi:MAG: hypothetical protein ABIJ59_09500 [Pseudomonadota bacterium]